MTHNLYRSKIKRCFNNIKSSIIKTPLEYNQRLSNKYGSNIYLKREDQQNVRSFKIRGALNKINTLSENQRKNGIVCASAGNHAQGFAVSCTTLGYEGKVYMPISTPNQKINQVKKFGKNNIEIVLYGENFTQAYKKAIEDCDFYNKIFRKEQSA